VSYESLKASLATCKNITSDNSTVTVCLAARAAGGGVPTLHRLQLTDDLADSFRTAAVEELRALHSGVDNGDVDLKRYDASIPVDRHEIEVHTPADGTPQRAVIEALDDLKELRRFDADTKTINNLIFHVVAIQRARQAPIYLFRKYSKAKELGRSKKLVTLFSDGTFDRITEPVFIFDDFVDCIWIDGQMMILNKDNFHRIFQFFTEVLKHAQRTLDEIKAVIPIENVDRFEQDCKRNAIILVKLRGIAQRDYLATLTLSHLRKKISSLDLPVQVSGKGAQSKLVYDPKHKWIFIRLLDDGFLTSDMTGTNYEVTGKRSLA
jgi:Domain of unknown function (DUF4868)